MVTRNFIMVMSTLMWAILHAESELPTPVNITLRFSRFGHILRWAPGPGTPTRTYYSVSTETDRRGLSLVAGCERVRQPLMCNLTGVLLDPAEYYTAMVTALLEGRHSEPAVIRRFKLTSHLELPLISVMPCGRNLCVDLQPPQEHFPESYNNIGYQLRITSSRDREFFKNIRSLDRVVLEDLAPGRLYCISVRFFDSLEDKHSNFSRPVCASTPGIFPEDPLISAVMCFLVMFIVGILASLLYSGVICLKTGPMPSPLTSIHHSEEGCFVASWPVSPSSPWNIWPIVHSVGTEGNKQSSSDESDEECSTETTGGSTGGGYKQYNLFTSSSFSMAPLSTNPKPVAGLTSDHAPDQFQPQTSMDTGSSAVPTNSVTVSRSEEEHMLEESAGLDVNLLTLTFGRQDVEEMELHKVKPEELELQEALDGLPEKADHSASEEYSLNPVWASQTVAGEVSRCTEEEEELDEDFGYMERPCTHDFQNL